MIVNDAIREVMYDVKECMKSASLSIVSGTSDYTISSAIGADVQKIVYITVPLSSGNPDGVLTPRTIWEYQKDKNATLTIDDDGTTDLVEGDAQFFKVLNDTTLSIYPEPDTSITATVYYYPKVVYAAYSTNNMAATIPLSEIYLDTLYYKAMEIFFESEGEMGLSDRSSVKSQAAAEKAKTNKISYGPNEGVKYHSF